MDISPPNTAQRSGIAWSRDDRHSLLLALMLTVLIVLMIVPEGLNYRSLATGGTPSAGGAISRILWAGLLVLSALVVFWRSGLAWLWARTLNPFLLLFVALAIVSVAWSIDPSLSVRRLVRMGTIVLVCAAFVLMSWHARRFQNVIRPVLTLMLLGSIVFGLLLPSLAIHQETSAELVGAWRGLANHKNGLGALSCFVIILWFHAVLTAEVRILSAAAGGVIAVTCLLLSRSSTAMAATVFALLLMITLLRSPQGLRPYVPYAIAMLSITLFIYGLAIVNLIPGLGTLLAPVTALTNKDVTFTGRSQIWTVIFDHIHYHPFLGTGYGAYWTAAPTVGTDSYAFIWLMGGFYPGSAHNGYLEIVNDLGWAGLACLIAYIAVYLRQSLQLFGIDRQQSILYLTLFFQQVVTNFAETHWFSVLSVDFVIMTLATAALARGLLEHRLHSVFGDPRANSDRQWDGTALLHRQKIPLLARGSGALR